MYVVGTSKFSAFKNSAVVGSVKQRLIQIKNKTWAKDICIVDMMTGDGWQKNLNDHWTNTCIAIQVAELLLEFLSKKEYRNRNYTFIINDIDPKHIALLLTHPVWNKLKAYGVNVQDYDFDAAKLTDVLAANMAKSHLRIFIYDFNGFKGAGGTIGMPSPETLLAHTRKGYDWIINISETAYKRSQNNPLSSFEKYWRDFPSYLEQFVLHFDKARYIKPQKGDANRYHIIICFGWSPGNPTKRIRPFRELNNKQLLTNRNNDDEQLKLSI